MNSLKHPTSSLANLIHELHLSDNKTKKVMSSTLFFVAFPAFLSIELLFQRLPQLLSSKIKINPQSNSLNIQKIKRLAGAIIGVYSAKDYPFSTTLSFMDTDRQKDIIRSNIHYLEFSSDEIKNDREFILKLLRSNPKVLSYASHIFINSHEFILEAIHYNSKALQFAPDALRDSPEFIADLVKSMPEQFYFASDYLRNNQEFIARIIRDNPEIFYYAMDSIRDNKEFVLKLIQINPGIIEYTSNLLREDYEVILEAVKSNGMLLQFASQLLKNSSVIVLEAIKNNSESFRHASEALKNNKEFIANVAKSHSEIFYFVSDALKNDRQFITQLVNETPEIFYYASETLRSNSEFVLELININTEVLQFASEKLLLNKIFLLLVLRSKADAIQYIPKTFAHNKDFIFDAFLENIYVLELAPKFLMKDREFALRLVRYLGEAFYYISDTFNNDREIVLIATRKWGRTLQFASDNLKDDREVVFEAIKKDSKVIEFASDRLRNDRTLVLMAVKLSGDSLQFVPVVFRDDTEVVLEAIKNHPRALQFASYSLRNEKRIVNEAIRYSYTAFQYASRSLRADQEFVLTAIGYDARALQFASYPLRNNKALVLELVKKDGCILQYASDELRDDRVTALTSVRQTPYAFEFVSIALQRDPEILRIAFYEMIPAHICKIGNRSYFPSYLPRYLKQLKLPDIPLDSSIDHLEVTLNESILSLNSSHLLIIQRELRDSQLTLEQAKSQLQSFNALLFKRIRNEEAYIGTPLEGSSELKKFYEDIKRYLRHLDFFFSKVENQMPNGLIERLQILLTQTACGARLQAELEQLYTTYCIPADLMSLDQQLALMASSEAKKIIQSMALGGNVHEINDLMWLLDSYLVGDKVVRDHLAYPRNKYETIREFFLRYSSKNLVSYIQHMLKASSNIEELFSNYIKENTLVELTTKEREEIQAQVEQQWNLKLDRKRRGYASFLEAKMGNGPYGHIKNREILRNIFQITENESECLNVDELIRQLEIGKEASISFLRKDLIKAFAFEKILRQHWDFEKNTWQESTIAQVLEVMGIFTSIN